jgi:hypothetical protein
MMDDTTIMLIGSIVLSALGIIAHSIRKSTCLGMLCETREERPIVIQPTTI